MKTLLAILLFLALFFGIWDLAWWKLGGVRQLHPWELKRMLREKPDDVVLLDVRTPLEYGWFHIPDAESRQDLLLDSTTLPEVAKDKDVVVICMTGHRSPVVAKKLQDKTGGRVYNLSWGMAGWLLFFGPLAR